MRGVSQKNGVLCNLSKWVCVGRRSHTYGINEENKRMMKKRGKLKVHQRKKERKGNLEKKENGLRGKQERLDGKERTKKNIVFMKHMTGKKENWMHALDE